MQSKDGEKAGNDIGLHTETSPIHEASFGSCQDRPNPDRERLPGPLSPAAKGKCEGVFVSGTLAAESRQAWT